MIFYHIWKYRYVDYLFVLFLFAFHIFHCTFFISLHFIQRFHTCFSHIESCLSRLSKSYLRILYTLFQSWIVSLSLSFLQGRMERANDIARNAQNGHFGTFDASDHRVSSRHSTPRSARIQVL